MNDPCLIAKPIRPAFAHCFLVDIVFGQLNEKMVVAGFAFHKAAIKLSEVGIIQAFAKAFEPLAAPGFDEGEREELIEEALGFDPAFSFEFPELVNV